MKEISRLIDITVVARFGAIAQLVEHLHGMQLSKAINRNLYQGLYQ